MNTAAATDIPSPTPADAPIPATATVKTAAAPAKWVTITVKLTFPITFGEETISSITLREPNIGAVEELDALSLKEGEAPTVEQSRKMIAILSGVSAEALKQAHTKDFAALVEAVTPLLEGEE